MTKVAAGVQVFKFGGSSLKDSAAIRQVASIVQPQQHTVVVVSAMGGMTDLLLSGLKDAAAGHLDAASTAAESFRQRHLAVISELVPVELRESLEAQTTTLTNEYISICESVAVLRELTERTTANALSRGERLMAQVLRGHLQQLAVEAVAVDATEIIKVVPSALGMYPAMDRCRQAVTSNLVGYFATAAVVIVPGFFGEGPEAQLVLLGRGGSDFSAAIIAASLGAKQLVLYKEVDGLMTADPRYVESARVIAEVHYREAAELAYYGAKILHPGTIIPISDANVPLVIKNTFAPERPGTRISAEASDASCPVKALTAIDDVALIAVEGKGMMGVPGVAARTFSALARGGISVSMISQASSESSICFVVPGPQAIQVKSLLEVEFQFEIQSHLVDGIKVDPQKAILALVGLGMSGARGTSARAFSALAAAGVNIAAIAQGSSELNISVAISQGAVARGLRALHREFRLDKAHGLPDIQGSKVSIGLMGFGQIGATLVEQIINQREYLEARSGGDISIVGLADSSGSLVEKNKFSTNQLEALIALKRSGQKLRADGRRVNLVDMAAGLRETLWQMPFVKGIFVDCTAEDTVAVLEEALLADMNVVLANKKPLAVPMAKYENLFALAQERGLQIRYEATVGAGLPVLDTLDKLDACGDEVQAISGCLSGTIGYIMSQLERGAKFSEIVATAYAQGYTEPDPREDLSGMDVARKALILARRLGRSLNMQHISLTPLVPDRWHDTTIAEFLEAIKDCDEFYAEKVAKAALANKVLRYVARIEGAEVSVGMVAVAKDSPAAQLRGTDNQVVIRSRFYDQNPLVVTGPGAGADVTAAGVLNDIMAIASAHEVK